MTTQRLEALSDGVFAVAITLLALDVRVLQLPVGATETALYDAVLALAPKFFTYLMTFVLVGMFWIAHHRMFTAIQHVDRALLWFNINLLLWICLLPLSASALGAYHGYRTSVIIYGLNVILVGQSLFGIWYYVCTRGLLHPHTDPELIRLSYWRILVGSPIYLLGIAISFWNPRVSSWVYLAALIMYLLPGKIDRHFSKAS